MNNNKQLKLNIMNKQLENYLELERKFRLMGNIADIWTVDYTMQKLIPLVHAGFDHDDITNFLISRWHAFANGSKFDELLENHAKEMEQETQNK